MRDSGEENIKRKSRSRSRRSNVGEIPSVVHAVEWTGEEFDKIAFSALV